MKKILVICGHPNRESLNAALVKTYIEEAQMNAEVKHIHLRDLEFNYNLEFGYQKRTELEPDLLKAQEDIKWADHLVFFYPTWWGTYPAVLKAFLDRTLLPGFAFKYKDNSPFWYKYLKGKSGRIITTMHTPKWYDRWINGAPSTRSMRRTTLLFCGVKPVKTTVLASTHNKEHLSKEAWFIKVKKLAHRDSKK